MQQDPNLGKPAARKNGNTFLIPMVVLTASLVVGIAVLALFLRLSFCAKEESRTGPDGTGTVSVPENGVPDDVLAEFAADYAGTTGADSFEIVSVQHSVNKAKKTDTVTFTLFERRADEVFQSRHIVNFAFDSASGRWTAVKHDHTTPETGAPAPPSQESQTTTPPPSGESQTTTPPPAQEELPDTFSFGGVTVRRGETGITGSKRGINGPDAEHLTHITAEEVELLVRLCPDLQVLDLDYCYLDDYAPLGRLTKLKKLVLTHCGTETRGNRIRSIDWVSGLKNLETLYLEHNDIQDLSPLNGLGKLEDLRLGRNKLTDASLASLTDLPSLKYLGINANSSIRSLSKLPVLENLRFIDVSQCKKLTSLSDLKLQPCMKMLKCDRSGLTDLDGVSAQPALVEIDLSGCSLALSEYRKLESCPKLEYVVIKEKDDAAQSAMDTVESNNSRISRLYAWKYISG